MPSRLITLHEYEDSPKTIKDEQVAIDRQYAAAFYCRAAEQTRDAKRLRQLVLACAVTITVSIAGLKGVSFLSPLRTAFHSILSVRREKSPFLLKHDNTESIRNINRNVISRCIFAKIFQLFSRGCLLNRTCILMEKY